MPILRTVLLSIVHALPFGPRLEAVRIVLFCILSAILYGIVHDQITARVCVEYFTIGHAPLLDTDSPTLLGLGWGIMATWWVGAILGVALAISARLGKRPTIWAEQLVEPISILLVVMAGAAIAAGVGGWLAASAGWLTLTGWLGEGVPANRHVVFIADLCAHNASYFFGFVGGLFVVRWCWYLRKVAEYGLSQGAAGKTPAG